jgi:hypothetical protein
VQPIQPVHPELQAQLDRVLNEYSAILHHVPAPFLVRDYPLTTSQINERAKKAHAYFDAFKGTGPPVGNEFQAPPEWSGQNIPALKRNLSLFDNTAKTIIERKLKLQQQLDDLSSSLLRRQLNSACGQSRANSVSSNSGDEERGSITLSQSPPESRVLGKVY